MILLEKDEKYLNGYFGSIKGLHFKSIIVLTGSLDEAIKMLKRNKAAKSDTGKKESLKQ